MPMFPLGTVLLPGGVLPLHIFEPRYRVMVQHCLEHEREFGVVLIARGHEVGGGDQRTSVGTIARMVQVAELADGRYAMITVGMRRIRVTEWLADDPYPRAEVEEFPDDEADVPDLGPITSRVRRLAALALELGDAVADPSQDLSEDPIAALYQLASLAPIGDADRYDVLSAPTAAERLACFGAALDDAEAALTFRLSEQQS